MKVSQEISDQIFEKTKGILGKKIVVTDDKGIVLTGGRHGDFSLYAYQAIIHKSVIEEKGDNFFTWSPLVYEDQIVGAYALAGTFAQITNDTLDLVQALAQVLIYQGLLMERVYSLDKARTTFLRDLLVLENIKNEDKAFEQADILRINLKCNQAVILLHIQNFQNNFLDFLDNYSPEEKILKFEEYISDIIKIIRDGFDGNDQNIIVYFGNDLFLILKGIRGEKVTSDNSVGFFRKKGKYTQELAQKAVKGVVTVGVGQYYHGLQGLKKSFQDAKLALEIGAKIWGLDNVYHILDVGIFVSLAPISHQRKAEITNQLLRPLIVNKELKKTVEIFLGSGMNLTKAAKDLHVHRNTLIYRLEKVSQLIGLDPRTFNGALQIKLGFMLASLK